MRSERICRVVGLVRFPLCLLLLGPLQYRATQSTRNHLLPRQVDTGGPYQQRGPFPFPRALPLLGAPADFFLGAPKGIRRTIALLAVSFFLGVTCSQILGVGPAGDAPCRPGDRVLRECIH